MRRIYPAQVVIVLLALDVATPALAQDSTLGRTVDSLLDYARSNNPSTPRCATKPMWPASGSPRPVPCPIRSSGSN